MNSLSKDSATWRNVDETSQDQRIDNYLQKILKGVPKSHIYRILRSGEVRVNSRRVQASYRLQDGDKIRLPPIRVSEKPVRAGPGPVFSGPVLFEDEDL